MKTTFVAPYVPSAVNALKIAALYFDEVVLNDRELLEVEETQRGLQPDQPNRGRIVGVFSAIDDKLRTNIELLINAGLVRIEAEPPPALLQPSQRQRLQHEFFESEHLLYGASEKWPEVVQVNVGDDGIGELHTRLVGPLKIGALFNFQAVSKYFEGLLIESVDAGLRGEPVLTSSTRVYELIQRAANTSVLDNRKIAEVFSASLQPRLAMDVLQAQVINVDALDCDDVVEVRNGLHDELAGFRAELQKLQFDFVNEFGFDKVFREGRAISNARLAPRVREIEGKLKGSRIRALRRLLESFEKPTAYVPLIGSLFAGLPVEIALGLSLGLVSSRVALEAWEEHQQVANDGLFYLVKLKRLTSTKGPRPRAAATTARPRSRKRSAKRLFMWPDEVEVVENS
jgi:hypothetical protein